MREIKDFERMELFNHFNDADNPFLYLTTEIDVTNVLNYCKVHKNFYATMGYILVKVLNMVDAFKYRVQDGKIYFCDRIKSNYTQKIDETKIGFFDLPDIDNYEDYIKEFRDRNNKLITEKNNVITEGIDCAWFSCFPWCQFTGIMTPYRKSLTIPQFIWDKFIEVNGRYKMHLMVMAHHGFVDGGHIGEFLLLLEKYISEFPENMNN